MVESLRWCSFCNEKPAEGTVTIEFVDTSEQDQLPACEECVRKMKWR